MSHVIRARAPYGSASHSLNVDPDVVARYLEDAAHVPGGHAAGVAMPETEADVAAVLRSAHRVLAVGAQSSLTGGATPRGDVVLSTSRFTGIELLAPDAVRAGAGVTLDALDDVLARDGRSYPPAPTFTGATVGGVVATNAAGAATFKYGSTRAWVQALTVILPDGSVLDLERGATRAHADGHFDLELSGRTVRVPVPRYRMPDVPKLSAGYFAAPGMDLVDLFVGSEGTLGVMTSVTLRVLRARPPVCRAFVPFAAPSEAFACAARLRDAAREAWRSGGRRGVDVAGIEHMDAQSIALLRADGLDRASGVRFPGACGMALLVTVELPSGVTRLDAYEQLGRARDADAPDTPLVRFCALLAPSVDLDDIAIAVPGDAARHRQLLTLRESVPAAVNARIGRAHAADHRVHKTAGDLLVPFEHLEAFTTRCEAEMSGRGLDFAIWGHISDGNIHPNVIPRTYDDVARGLEALRVLGREAIRLGGVPLAEHGVGRSPLKQQLLTELYGAWGVGEMQRLKRAIDPEWKLAPGVMFPPP